MLIDEGVDRVAQAVAFGSVRAQLTYCRRKLLGEAGNTGRSIAAGGLGDDRAPHMLQLQGGHDGTDVAEGLVKGRHLQAGGMEQLRPDRVEDGMSELVTEDV